MGNPIPKPEPRQKKPRTRLKPGDGNPFPDSVKKKAFELQKGKCAYSGISVPTYKDLEYHHVKFKGSTSKEWEHDHRNCVGLLPIFHKPMIHMGQHQTFYRLYWEVWTVFKYGWMDGEETSFAEWVENNEYRLKKAKIDPLDLHGEYLKRMR